jgi:hypothetical protein
METIMDFQNLQAANCGAVLHVGDALTYYHAFGGYQGSLRSWRILKIDSNSGALVKLDTKDV